LSEKGGFNGFLNYSKVSLDGKTPAEVYWRKSAALQAA